MDEQQLKPLLQEIVIGSVRLSLDSQRVGEMLDSIWKEQDDEQSCHQHPPSR